MSGGLNPHALSQATRAMCRVLYGEDFDLHDAGSQDPEFRADLERAAEAPVPASGRPLVVLLLGLMRRAMRSAARARIAAPKFRVSAGAWTGRSNQPPAAHDYAAATQTPQTGSTTPRTGTRRHHEAQENAHERPRRSELLEGSPRRLGVSAEARHDFRRSNA